MFNLYLYINFEILILIQKNYPQEKIMIIKEKVK